MKHRFEKAADLFRQNQHVAQESLSDAERENFYQGLALMAEGLYQLEKRVEKIEAEATSGIFKGPRKRLRPRIFLAAPAP